MIYAAVLPPPVGNLRKLQLKWRGPLQITEIINQAMVRIKEINVTNHRKYDAHISKLRLAKKFGEQYLNIVNMDHIGLLRFYQIKLNQISLLLKSRRNSAILSPYFPHKKFLFIQSKLFL